MSRRHGGSSEVVYDDRRERDYTSSRGGSRYEDDRYYEQEVQFRRSAPPPVRERERDEIDFREERTTRAREVPAFLREDYGRTSAGPIVLRAREREEFDFAPAPPAPRSRRRSPSPESDRKTERESIIIRRDRDETESRAPPPRRERSRERDEIIIRRDRDETESRAPPRRERSIERDEIIIRRDRDETESRAPPRRERSIERDEIIIRRDERERARPAPPPPPSPPLQKEVSREEIIIRREERSSSRPAPREDRETERIVIRRRDEDDRSSRYEPPPPPRELEYALVRPKSRERERSMARHDSDSDHEIIIKREETKGRGRDATRSREEIIIRSNSRSNSPSRSPSPAPSVKSYRSTRSRAMPPPEPQIVYAPQIHQEVITHHKHIDHGYEVAIPQRPRPISRPPSPPSPPPPQPPPPARDQSEERIEIRRTETRNGRRTDEDIIIDRREDSRSRPPSEPEHYDPPAPRRAPPRWRDERDIEEEAEYYNQRALERSYPGEGYHGATRDWALVDVPPGTRKVRMDGAGGGAQEISWQRYNGMRRSKFYPEADDDEAYSSVEISRPAPPPAPLPRPEPLPATGGDIGRRYGKTRDPKAGLWTEVTKDLVIKEAITEMGYEYEETDDYYYIIAYLKYEDVARLVGLSEDIRKERRRRVKEIEWESRIEPEISPPPRRPLAIEPPAPVRSPRSTWEREDERYIEREVVYRGSRPPPPPPPGWRR